MHEEIDVEPKFYKRYIGLALEDRSCVSCRHPELNDAFCRCNNVVVLIRYGSYYPLYPRLEVVNHSPTGFAWGYAGSGPAQLALAILSDCYNDDTALRWHQDFKNKFIVKLDMNKDFMISERDIEEWIDGYHR